MSPATLFSVQHTLNHHWAKESLEQLDMDTLTGPVVLLGRQQISDHTARAGHFWYFLIFSIINNFFLHFLSL